MGVDFYYCFVCCECYHSDLVHMIDIFDSKIENRHVHHICVNCAEKHKEHILTKWSVYVHRGKKNDYKNSKLVILPYEDFDDFEKTHCRSPRDGKAKIGEEIYSDWDGDGPLILKDSFPQKYL